MISVLNNMGVSVSYPTALYTVDKINVRNEIIIAK